MATLKLYHCAGEGSGFFVEVSVAGYQSRVVHSFRLADSLELYLDHMALPDDWWWDT